MIYTYTHVLNKGGRGVLWMLVPDAIASNRILRFKNAIAAPSLLDHHKKPNTLMTRLCNSIKGTAQGNIQFKIEMMDFHHRKIIYPRPTHPLHDIGLSQHQHPVGLHSR
jgi:hypothetical protein